MEVDSRANNHASLPVDEYRLAPLLDPEQQADHKPGIHRILGIAHTRWAACHTSGTDIDGKAYKWSGS